VETTAACATGGPGFLGFVANMLHAGIARRSGPAIFLTTPGGASRIPSVWLLGKKDFVTNSDARGANPFEKMGRQLTE
jgi:hypothetical protein